jgi:hypothetical protein
MQEANSDTPMSGAAPIVVKKLAMPALLIGLVIGLLVGAFAGAMLPEFIGPAVDRATAQGPTKPTGPIPSAPAPGTMEPPRDANPPAETAPAPAPTPTPTPAPAPAPGSSGTK